MAMLFVGYLAAPDSDPPFAKRAPETMSRHRITILSFLIKIFPPVFMKYIYLYTDQV
jgi:hypothetical protein